MYHCLALIEPLDPVSGDRLPVRVASADLVEICSLGDVVWEPAMIRLPQLAVRLFNGDLGERIAPGALALTLALDVLTGTYGDAEQWDWSGAPVTLYYGEAGDPWPWTAIMQGRVRQYGGQDRKLAITAEVDTEPFDADVLPLTYAGTGGAQGGDDLKDKVKPLVLGHASNVEPVLLNAVDSVYQFSGYGPIEAVTTLYERGSDFGAVLGDYANYAALVAATIPPGRWATCLAEGLIRLGAPAYGVITGDVRGHKVGASTPRLPGAVISALAGLAGISPGLIVASGLAALDADKPYPTNWVFGQQVSFIEAATGIADSCNWLAGVSLLGKFVVKKPDFAPAADVTLESKGGSSPQVVASPEQSTSPPYSKVTLGAARAWRVHGLDELAGGYIARGPFESTAFYRLDDWVFAADGRAFVYVNATPSAGNAPPLHPATSNEWWALFGSANQGVQTYRSPTAPPENPVVGSLYVDAERFTYRFEGLGLEISGQPITFFGEPIEGPGYVQVLPEPVATGALQVTVTPPNDQTVYTDVAGEVLEGQFPRTLTPVVQRGGVDIRTSPDATYAIVNTGMTATVNNIPGSPDKGRITVTGGTVGSINLTVMVAGVAYGPFRIRFLTSPAAAPLPGGTGSQIAQDTTFPAVTSTTFAEVAGPLTLTVGTGETVKCTFPALYQYTARGAAARALVGQWEWSPAGAGTWTAAAGSPITGSESSWDPEEFTGIVGSGNFNQDITGLTAGDYDFRFMGKLSASGLQARIDIFESTATVRIDG